MSLMNVGASSDDVVEKVDDKGEYLLVHMRLAEQLQLLHN